MSVQQSTELIIFVTHVEAEDSYLKIWGQIDKNSATCVERMILPLAEQFARSQGCGGPQAAGLRINALCCARFQNEGYYRARVINIRSDGMVVLQFIDYGNIEVLPPQEIHLLENIPGSESLQSFPPVAFEFTLMHVLPVNGVWENKIIESIKKTLWYNEYKILIHSTVGNHRFIKLWYNNEDFGELLVKRHMAVAATLQEMFRPKSQVLLYQQPNKRIISTNHGTITPTQNTILSPTSCESDNTQTYRRNIPPCCVPQQKYVAQSPPVQEALVFKSRVLDVGSKHDVYVSFVEDGPQKFSVQVQSTSQVLSMLMRDINTHPIEPLQEPPLPGSVCLGRYTQDKVLCRAVVMSVMENKCKLYYVDFGHTEVLPYTDIFQLPPHYINPRVLSIRFTLSGVKELNVTEEMKEYFKKIVSGKPLVLHVRPPEGPPLVQYGDLYDNGKNIKDILRQAFPSPVVSTISTPLLYHEPQKLTKGMEEIVHVSFVESTKKFFVQLDSSIKSLESIMTCLDEFCKTAPALSPAQIRAGAPCAALYENQWYRARILNVTAENVNVLYVDYGNEETVPAMSLRLIHEDLVKKLQAQAIRCILNGWELLPYNDEISNQFELLILEKHLRMRVVDLHSNGLVVDLHDPDTMKNIKTQLQNLIPGNEKVNATLDCQNFEIQPSAKVHNPKSTQSENKGKWPKKGHVDSWHETHNGVPPEKGKTKTWKDESNEEKRQDNKPERSNFFHLDSRNERLNRDSFANNRNTKEKWNTKAESNEVHSFNRGAKSGRGGRSGKIAGGPSKHNYTTASDKSWSDKDSDTSSRGSNRRGRGGANRGNYMKRDGPPVKVQGNKWSDKDYDSGSYNRGGKTNSDFHRGGRKERRGQGHRLIQNKQNVSSFQTSSSSEETQRSSPVKIPSPVVTIGSTQNCEVVFANSPMDFYIQLSSNYAALDSVMEHIASIYENGGEFMKHSEITNNAYCIAQYSEDLKWYRAVIKSVEGKGATVQFVDYGNKETVEFSKVKTIQKEFLKLPIQAIQCKLLGIDDFNLDPNEMKAFVDHVTGKTLEVEFVTRENGTYNVLLRELIDGSPATTYINEEFCKGIDITKAKQDVINRKQPSSNSKQLIHTDYAPPNSKWTTVSYEIGTKQDVIITWFTNPNNFYCQTLSNENEFRSMMNEIQKIYIGREPVSYPLQVGSPVIAIFSEDGALYRAEVVELNKPNGHIVQYIDFGNNAVVEPQKIYPVEKKLMQLPKQAVQCCLTNIIPKNGFSWSKINTDEIDKCFNADKYECSFHEIKDNKYLISLNSEGKDVAETLVERNLASFATSKTDAATGDGSTTKTLASYDVQRMDISLLGGQTLKVKVSNVESVDKFHIQLPSAAESENIINAYMADKDPAVMQQLSTREMCLGTGCLVYTNGVWRRAVISNGSRSAGFDVKLIDTGAYDEILSDCVLALPGELSVMQNQAIECSFKNAVSSPETNAKLKELIEGKEVIVYIEEVDNNRLIVKVFDAQGNKIKVFDDVDEKICPICPMPILTSTHKVLVSSADHSASIWLQRSSEYSLDANLVQALELYYPNSGKTIEPKPGLLCAAKGADGHWYRAKITRPTEIGAYVTFIDYGNNEEVGSDSLMELDSQFYTPHQLAVNVSLSVTLNGTESEQVETLQNYLLNKELTAIFYNVDMKWVVELIYDGEKLSDKFRLLNSMAQQQQSFDVGQAQVHNMEAGYKYEVYVSHVDSPSQFWLQSVEEAANLAKRQEDLQVQAPTFPTIDGIPEEGTLCVAVYSIDNLWYRAQVLDADEDITTVRFIDYGNTDVIDNKSGNIRQLADSWKEVKEYAVKCRLDVIPVDSEDWNGAVCEKFENMVTSVESLQALIISNSAPKRVDLFVNEKSISETLVEDHHAIMIHTEEDLIDEIVDLELDPHSAFVSHINSPSEFWVQEEKSVADLEVLTDRFIVADMFPKVDEIKEDLLCVAKFPEDEQWYRARVVSHGSEGTQVIYIDYGNSAISTEIRAIPSDLASVPPLSRKCCLAMPDGVTEWSERACSEFIRLAADGATIFLLDVLKEDESSIVKLTFNNKSVADILAEYCTRYPPIIEERLPPLGEENSPNVLISHINTPDEFWIQAESNITDLEVMSDRLHAASSFLPLSTFETNTICVAKYPQDDRWYRAKIVSHSEEGTEVLYIDYGNSAVTTEVRMLPEDIINIPALSKRCTLQKPSIIKSWSTEACEEFEKLAATGATMFEFETLDTNDPICVKLSLNGKDIVDMLVSLCKNTSCDKSVTKEEQRIETVEDCGKDDHTETTNSCSGEQSIKDDVEKVEDNDSTNVEFDTCQPEATNLVQDTENIENPGDSDCKKNEIDKESKQTELSCVNNGRKRSLTNTSDITDNSHTYENVIQREEDTSNEILDNSCNKTTSKSETDSRLSLENVADIEGRKTDDDKSEDVNLGGSNVTITEDITSSKLVVELTVDDIIQNMDRNVSEDADEEESVGIDVNYTIINKTQQNKDDIVQVKDSKENLEVQDNVKLYDSESKTCETDVTVDSNYVDTKKTSDDTHQKTEEAEIITKNDLPNTLEKEVILNTTDEEASPSPLDKSESKIVNEDDNEGKEHKQPKEATVISD